MALFFQNIGTLMLSQHVLGFFVDSMSLPCSLSLFFLSYSHIFFYLKISFSSVTIAVIILTENYV